MNSIFRSAALILSIALSIAPHAAFSASRGGDQVKSAPSAADDIHAASERPTPPIHSRAALDAYLRAAAEHGQSTPLDRFSPGARIRFLGSLEFSERGSAQFLNSEFPDELDATELRDLLALFGQQDMAGYYPSADTPDPSTSTFHTSDNDLGEFERRFNRFYFYSIRHPGPDESEAIIASHLQQQLAATFPEIDNPGAFAKLGDHEIRLLFRAADTAASYATNPRLVSTSAELLRSMEQRGIASTRDIKFVHEQLLRVRHFDQARRFAASHPGIAFEQLPALNDALPASYDRPSVWVVAADGRSMKRTPVDLQPLQILVMAGCHFSEDAAKAISTDPVLGPVFRDHARWLMQPPGEENPADVREWNRKYPEAQAEMVYDRSRWSVLGRWSMPTYVIVKDGKVLAQANGWPPNPDRQHLIDLLQQAGFKLGDTNSARADRTMPKDDAKAQR